MPRRGQVIRFPGRHRNEGDDRALVEVHRGDQAEAVVIRSLLESEAIPTLLRSQLLQSVHPFSVGHQGEVVVLVPAEAATRARVLLARSRSKRIRRGPLRQAE